MSNNQPPNSKKMLDHPVEDRFRSNDLELLETGRYSDAQVMVGDRVWKVHKGIVCQRSGYMREVDFRSSKDGEPIPEELPSDTTEKWAELLLEFIYSGSIKTIDGFSMEDCVELSIVGKDFRVDGMVSYSTNKLCDKLKATLRCVSTIPGASRGAEGLHGLKVILHDIPFEFDFGCAVSKAYSRPGNACQLLLADFVWTARDQLLGTPFIERLNSAHVLFGSHVLTTLNKGPQTSFLTSDGRPPYAFCFECIRHQAKRPSRALQLFDHKSS